MARSWLVFLVLVGVSACAPVPPPPTPGPITAGPTIQTPKPQTVQPKVAAGTLSGVVRNNLNAPIGDARVQLRDLPELLTRSNSQGRYTLNPVPPGEYVVLAWTSELIASSLTVTVAPAANVMADFVLVTVAPVAPGESSGTIAGLVRASNGNPVNSANVRIRDRPQLATKSASNGRFVLADVPVGNHVLDAFVSEFETAHQEVTVTPNTTTNVQLTLITAIPKIVTPQGKPPINVVPNVVLTLAPAKVQPAPGVKIAPTNTPVPSKIPSKG